jgi:hypothetical protein
MSGKILIWLLITFLLITFAPAQAQQPKKVPLIGRLGASSPESARTNALRQGSARAWVHRGKKHCH